MNLRKHPIQCKLLNLYPFHRNISNKTVVANANSVTKRPGEQTLKEISEEWEATFLCRSIIFAFVRGISRNPSPRQHKNVITRGNFTKHLNIDLPFEERFDRDGGVRSIISRLWCVSQLFPSQD